MKKEVNRLIKHQLRLNRTLNNNNPLLNKQLLGPPTKNTRIAFIGSKLTNTINSLTNNSKQQQQQEWAKQLNLDIRQTHTNWETNPLRTAQEQEEHPLNAQLIIIVFDPITEYHLLKQQLTLLSKNKNIHQPLLILLDSPVPAELLKPILFKESLLGLEHPTIFIDSQAALDAIHHFHRHHHHQAAIDRIRNSGLLELRQAIHSALQPASSPQPEELRGTDPNQLRAALSLAELALDLAEDKVLTIVEDTQTASTRLHQYQLRLQRLQKLARSVRSLSDPVSQPPSLQTTLFKLAITRLGFFKTLFSSDLVGTRASILLDQLCLDQIEKNLIFQAGQMQIIKQRADEVIEELLRDPILARYRSETLVNDVLRSRATHHDLFLLDQHHPFSEKEKGKTQIGSVQIFEQHKRRLIGQAGPVQSLQNKASRMSVNNLLLALGIGAFSFSSLPSLLLFPIIHLPAYPALASTPSLPLFLAVSAVWYSQKSWAKTLHSFVVDVERWNRNLHHHLLDYQRRVGERIFLLSASSSSSPATTTASQPSTTTTQSGNPQLSNDDHVRNQAHESVDLIQAIRDNIQARLNVSVVETDEENDEHDDDDDDDGNEDEQSSGSSSTVNLVEWVHQLRRHLESLKSDLSSSSSSHQPPPSSSSSSATDQSNKSITRSG